MRPFIAQRDTPPATAGNRIGVGMTNPSREVHLRKFSSGNVDFLHQNNGSGAARFIVQSSARQWIWTAGADGKYSLFGTGGAGNALIVDVNGNVGIKDATPEEALTVVGDFQVSGTGMVAILEITGGSDLSEQFQIASDGLAVIPSMLVSIDA